MKARALFHNPVVAALLVLFTLTGAVWAQTADLDKLFDDLKSADAPSSERIEQEIWNEWSKSGSPAMDLLLQRGREAMGAGETEIAIEHFTALIDHAPDFAEGWNARATVLYQMGQFGPSMADIAQTLKLNPRHFGAMSGFAMILEDLGRPEQALEVHQAVKAIHPNAAGVSEAIDRLTADLQGSSL